MLARVLRIPGKVLGVLFLAALVAHGVRIAPTVWFAPGELALDALLGIVPACVCGRVLLALLPPGDVGGHSPRSLPLTAAVALGLGLPILARLESPTALAVGAALLATLAALRWLTLPGAMVPRHAVLREPRGLLDSWVELGCAAWAVALVLTIEAWIAVAWLALFLVLFHALGVARRLRAGRHGVLALGAFAPLVAADEVYTVAFSLGLGGAFLVPWLRRADRRAGALSALGFASLLLGGAAPLALAGALVLVLASHPRQRAFALAWIGAASACALGLAALTGDVLPDPRGRLLAAAELREAALDPLWGVAWPIVGAALLLGALSFRWRAAAWVPGTIEEPRREALALAALLALACAALALPLSPWAEQEVLVILFPLAALLAGLLLIPPERMPRSA